jgi:hypothetical protein
LKNEAGNPVSERKRTMISTMFRAIMRKALKVPADWLGTLEALQITSQPGGAIRPKHHVPDIIAFFVVCNIGSSSMTFIMESLNVLGQDEEICDEYKEKRQHRERAEGIEHKELQNQSKGRQQCAPSLGWQSAATRGTA